MTTSQEDARTDARLGPLVHALVNAPYPAKAWIARRPVAWRCYTGACRRLGWDKRCLGWHTPRNGPFAGIRIEALHTNHLWAPAGLYEPAVAQTIVTLVRDYAPGRGEVWDVGANRGLMSLLAAKHGAERVVAIELLPSNIALLERQLAANPGLSTRIDVVPVAASDADGAVEILVNAHDGAVCQIVASEVRPYERTNDTTIERSAARTIDSLVAERGAHVAVVKIDVEGAEALVLRGAVDLLRAQAPAIVAEIHHEEAGRACGILLRDAGYGIERLMADGSLVPVEHLGGYGHIVARREH